jgi:hypothetical protein
MLVSVFFIFYFAFQEMAVGRDLSTNNMSTNCCTKTLFGTFGAAAQELRYKWQPDTSSCALNSKESRIA